MPYEIDILERLYKARSFIDTNFTLPLDLNLIAAQAFLSPYHFLRLFKRTFYMTPHQYLTRKRIERAKELLKDSELSIMEICFEVGFESVGSFSTLFHKYAGFPPAAYRMRVYRFFNLGVIIPEKYIPCCYLKKFNKAYVTGVPL